MPKNMGPALPRGHPLCPLKGTVGERDAVTQRERVPFHTQESTVLYGELAEYQQICRQ